MHFEYTCNRSGLFNEHYLSVAVGQILNSTLGPRVLSEFDHPILSPLMSGPGRRPALDFVYCENYPKIKVAVETKWAGSANTTPASIIWDLIRLELVAHHHNANCIFLLAGKRCDLESLFRDKDFSGPPKTPGCTPILSSTKNSQLKLSLLPDKHYRNPLLRSVFSRCQNVTMPHKIVTRRADPFPISCPLNQFQVYAWEVRSAPNRAEFVPGKNKHFQIIPKSS